LNFLHGISVALHFRREKAGGACSAEMVDGLIRSCCKYRLIGLLSMSLSECKRIFIPAFLWVRQSIALNTLRLTWVVTGVDCFAELAQPLFFQISDILSFQLSSWCVFMGWMSALCRTNCLQAPMSPLSFNTHGFDIHDSNTIYWLVIHR
jgi:hypothetical protein